jgi:hypothetical protein
MAGAGVCVRSNYYSRTRTCRSTDHAGSLYSAVLDRCIAYKHTMYRYTAVLYSRASAGTHTQQDSAIGDRHTARARGGGRRGGRWPRPRGAHAPGAGPLTIKEWSLKGPRMCQGRPRDR